MSPCIRFKWIYDFFSAIWWQCWNLINRGECRKSSALRGTVFFRWHHVSNLNRLRLWKIFPGKICRVEFHNEKGRLTVARAHPCWKKRSIECPIEIDNKSSKSGLDFEISTDEWSFHPLLPTGQALTHVQPIDFPYPAAKRPEAARGLPLLFVLYSSLYLALRSFGSKTSRSPSPIRFQPIEKRTIATTVIVAHLNTIHIRINKLHFFIVKYDINWNLM